MIKITKKQFVDKLDEFKNKIFSVEFIKKDGSVRNMNARLGVKKFTKGVGMAYEPTDYGLIVAFDMQKMAYRMINTNTLISAKVAGQEFSIESETI
jgi:hypothetical protein